MYVLQCALCNNNNNNVPRLYSALHYVSKRFTINTHTDCVNKNYFKNVIIFATKVIEKNIFLAFQCILAIPVLIHIIPLSELKIVLILIKVGQDSKYCA